MTSDLLLRRLLLVAFVLAILQAGWQAALLPTLSAAWFDAAGRPLWFVPTPWLAWAHVGLAATVAFAALLLPARSAPPAPPPDAEPAVARVARRVRERYFMRHAWLGLVTLLVLGGLAQLVYDANRSAIPQLDADAALWLLGGYGVFLVLWGAAGRRRIARRAPPTALPPAGREDPP